MYLSHLDNRLRWQYSEDVLLLFEYMTPYPFVVAPTNNLITNLSDSFDNFQSLMSLMIDSYGN